MPHDTNLITTIVVSFVFALFLGLIAKRLKFPPIVGYLLAGVFIGFLIRSNAHAPAVPSKGAETSLSEQVPGESVTPETSTSGVETPPPDKVSSEAEVPKSHGSNVDIGLSKQLAEIGVALLMFGVGLHFSLKDLLAVRRIALPGAILQIAVATILGMSLAWYFGWSLGASIVFGLALSVASTVVLIKALEQFGQLHSSNGQIAVGWLIVEDLVMILVLVLLPSLAQVFFSDNAGSDSSITGMLEILFISLGKTAIFIALMLIVGKRVFPWLLNYVAGTHSRELFTLSVIAIAVGVAFGSVKLFSVSEALGAFFAGMVMRESKLAHRAAEEALPFIDAFSVLFFVSIGMIFDPNVLIEHPFRVLAVIGIIIIGKSLAAFFLILALRYPVNTALIVSASLAQIGEFSFILGGLGVHLKLLPEEGMSLILAGALISISLNYFVFHLVTPLQNWIQSHSRLSRMLSFSDDPLAHLPDAVKSSEVTGHVVLVGYGHMGQKIGGVLTKKGIKFVVVDLNRELVEELRNKNIKSVFGEAADENVLIQAHVTRAEMIVITILDTVRAKQMVDICRILNPKIKVVIRTSNEEESNILKAQNLGQIFFAEQELAKNMIDGILLKISHHKHGKHH